MLCSESPAAAPAPALCPGGGAAAPAPALCAGGGAAAPAPAPALESPAAALRRRAPGAGRPSGSGAIPESEACRIRIHKSDRALAQSIPQLREFLTDYRAVALNGTGPRWSKLQDFFIALEEVFPDILA